jgi:hypothetical protein
MTKYSDVSVGQKYTTVDVVTNDKNLAKLVVLTAIEKTAGGAGGGSGTETAFTKVDVTTPGSPVVRYYGDKTAAEKSEYVKAALAEKYGVAVDSYNTVSGKAVLADGTVLTVSVEQVYKVTQGNNVAYIDAGATTIAGANSDLDQGNYLISGTTVAAAADATVAANGAVTFANLPTGAHSDITLVAAYEVTKDSSVNSVVTTSGGTDVGGKYVADGTALTVTGKKTTSTPAVYVALTDDNHNILDGGKAATAAAQTYSYTVNGTDITLKEEDAYKVSVMGASAVDAVVDGTIKFAITVEKSDIYANVNGTLQSPSATITVNSDGKFVYTVKAADAYATDATITIVAAYLVKQQNDTLVTLYTDSGLTTPISNDTTKLVKGATVYVKLDAASDYKYDLTAATKAGLTPVANATNNVYSFTVSGEIGKGAFAADTKTVAAQTSSDAKIYSDLACQNEVSDGARVATGTTLYVKAEAGHNLDQTTIDKLSETSSSGVYSFVLNDNVANNAYTAT